jgi:drug/metabolite transporter (DMT)-like permease
VLAILLLGERPSWLILVGAAVVVSGVMVIGFAGRHTGDNKTGVIYGLLVGIFIAVFTLWDASAVTIGEMPPIGLYWGSVLFQALLLTPFALRDREQTVMQARQHWVAVLLVGILAPFAYILILFAIQLAPVSVIAPAREVSVVLVGLAGWLVFKEPHPVQRLVGAAVVLVGVGLLAAG